MARIIDVIARQHRVLPKACQLIQMAKVVLNPEQMQNLLLSSKKADNVRTTNTKAKKGILFKIKPGIGSASLLTKLKKLKPRNFKQVDIMKKKQATEASVKPETFNENDDNLLMLELRCSWQESALRALELNEKCIAAINQLKEQSRNAYRLTENFNKSSSADSGAGSTRSNSPVQYQPHEIPPPPPPRNAVPYAPPVPPLPSHLLHNTPPALPVRNLLPPPPVQPRINAHSPLVPSTSHLNQRLIQQMQTLNLHEYSLLPNRGLTFQFDYRNSPSSGFYSCASNSSASSTNMPVNQLDSPCDSHLSKPPVILQSVKSTQVQRPKLQKAVAPASQPPPPPYSAQLDRCSGVCQSVVVPTTDPPTYASSVQSMSVPSYSLCATTALKPPLSTCAELRRPPLPLPNLCEEQEPSSPDLPDIDTQKIQHQSPIPERKKAPQDDDRRDFKVPPQAFKFFMEQHIENVIKSHKQRIYRRLQLETEMTKIGLSAQAQCQMRKMLCQKESNYNRLKRTKMDKSMFTKIKLIGVGAFGEVTLVRKIDTHQLYAMKTLRKVDVLKRNQVAHVKAERDILAEADNEWVVKLYFSFQDVDNLYFVMEYIPGGDLMSLLIKLGIFEEKLARFYLAELTCAVESVHKIGFIHRDIKPDNILIDRDGHIKLTDFGLCTGFRWTHNSKYYENGHNRQDSMDFSKKWSNGVDCKCAKLKPLEHRRRREEHQRCLAHSLVGTPNYIAPEVLLRTGYTQLCDWWSVGVVLYEMLIGSPPFAAESPTATQHKIINWQNTLRIPPNADVSPEAVDLILKLCTSANTRLGKNADEIKQHPFLAGVDFSCGGIRKLTSPYVPKIHYSTDTSNFDPVQSDDSHDSYNSIDSNSSGESSSTHRPIHGFFEFTFRRFFDDGGGVPFPAKINVEEHEGQNAIYV